MNSEQKTLISASACSARLSEPSVRILDASFHLPEAGRDAEAEFLAGHIPGARRFVIDAIADHSTSLPHMLPSAEDFAKAMAELGISNQDTVIVYDTTGLLGAARAWWMLRTFGHEQVFVLDGGFRAWQHGHHPIEEGPPPLPTPGAYQARLIPEAVRSRAQVLAALQNQSARIVDARSTVRFQAEAAEPRPGLRSGHIPGSANIPIAALLNDNGTLKDRPTLSSLFQAAGVDPTQPIITTCGSGITACALALALEQLGATNVGVYDGSWAEWGADTTLPIEVGPPRSN